MNEKDEYLDYENLLEHEKRLCNNILKLDKLIPSTFPKHTVLMYKEIRDYCLYCMKLECNRRNNE